MVLFSICRDYHCDVSTEVVFSLYIIHSTDWLKLICWRKKGWKKMCGELLLLVTFFSNSPPPPKEPSRKWQTISIRIFLCYILLASSRFICLSVLTRRPKGYLFDCVSMRAAKHTYFWQLTFVGSEGENDRISLATWIPRSLYIYKE